MFVFTVKSSVIGAYTTGSLFGKSRFSPKISPGKSWGGLIGVVVFASIVAVMFPHFYGIMKLSLAVVFGVIFAIFGQFADLAELMIKRDTDEKDSSQAVPGFGGILDVIDSPLARAAVVYLFFMLTAN